MCITLVVQNLLKNLSSLSNNIAPAVSSPFGKHKAAFTLSHHPNFLSKSSRRKNIQTPRCCHHGYASDSPVRKDIILPCLLSQIPSLRREVAGHSVGSASCGKAM